MIVPISDTSPPNEMRLQCDRSRRRACQAFPSPRSFASSRLAGVCRVVLAAVILLALRFPSPLRATDLPHTDGNNCSNCHMVHNALGGVYLSVVNGNANLCQSCHVPGGSASAKALSNSDQAFPAQGLPAGVAPSGNSHRWDSGVAGHVVSVGGAAIASTGTVQSSGTFNGMYAKTYTLTISNPGAVGVATFDWTATTPGGGSGTGLLTGSSVALDQGINAVFTGSSGALFQTGDQWQIYVRTDLQAPTTAGMPAMTSTNGQMMCSTCHDQHSQRKTPFDPTAPPYVSGSGAGRHFMISDNNADQLCVDCHAPRNVTDASAGSHPVGIPIPTSGFFKNPSLLTLTASSNNVACETCHDLHFAPGNDGSLLHLTDRRALCTDCHTLANTSTPAAHFNTASASLLWPGGQYGSVASGTTTFPAVTGSSMQGTCGNCHQVHGWPVASGSGAVYSNLLVDQDPTLCFTCHDSDGPAVKNVQTDFVKLRHHPVTDAEQIPGRETRCGSCHNTHQALLGSRDYNGTATSARNAVASSPALQGASGVAVDYSTLGNFAAPSP